MNVPEELYNSVSRPAPAGGGYDSSGINPQASQPRPMPAPDVVARPPVLSAPPGLPPRPGQATTQSPGGIIPPHMQGGPAAPPVMEPMGSRMPAPPQAPRMPAGQAYKNRPVSNNGMPPNQRRPVGRPVTAGMMGRRR